MLSFLAVKIPRNSKNFGQKIKTYVKFGPTRHLPTSDYVLFFRGKFHQICFKNVDLFTQNRQSVFSVFPTKLSMFCKFYITPTSKNLNSAFSKVMQYLSSPYSAISTTDWPFYGSVYVQLHNHMPPLKCKMKSTCQETWKVISLVKITYRQY